VHELSVALSIIDGVLEEAGRRKLPEIEAVHLRLGLLAGVDRDALLFAYKLACEGTALGNSRLVIEDVSLVIFCPSCKAETRPDDLLALVCPACGALAERIVRGNELEISALEVAA
jgi:hydrogenase nickel incorporation protein HypA/HybF